MDAAPAPEFDSPYDESMDVVQAEVSISEFKAHLSAYLAHVQQGARVIVTDRGRAVARILPVEQEAEERRARLIADGLIVPRRSKVRRLPKPTQGLTEGSILEFLDRR